MASSEQSNGGEGTHPQNFDLTEARTVLDELRDALNANLSQSDLTPSILKKSKRPNKKNLKIIPGTDTFSKEMRDRVSSNVVKSIYQATSSADGLAEFAFSNAAQDRILALHIDDFDVLQDWLRDLPEVSSLENFEKGENFQNYINAVFSYLNVYGYKNDVYVIADWSTSMFLQRSGLSAYFMKNANNFDFMESENIITLTDHVDFFVVGKYLFIKNNDKFEQIVNFRKVTEGFARQAFDRVVDRVPIKNAESVFKELSKGARNVKKLAKVANMPHVKDLDIDDIDNLIQKEELPLKVEDGEIVVDATDREQAAALLNVVMDAFVQSQMTKYKYLVHDADVRE